MERNDDRICLELYQIKYRSDHCISATIVSVVASQGHLFANMTMLQRIVPFPFIFSWSTCLRIAEIGLTLHLVWTMKTQVNMSTLAPVAGSAVTFLVLVEDVLLAPRGYTLSLRIKSIGALINIVVFLWQIHIICCSRTHSILPMSALIVSWSTVISMLSTIFCHVIITYLSTSEDTKNAELARRIDKAIFRPEYTYLVN